MLEIDGVPHAVLLYFDDEINFYRDWKVLNEFGPGDDIEAVCPMCECVGDDIINFCDYTDEPMFWCCGYGILLKDQAKHISREKFLEIYKTGEDVLCKYTEKYGDEYNPSEIKIMIVPYAKVLRIANRQTAIFETTQTVSDEDGKTLVEAYEWYHKTFDANPEVLDIIKKYDITICGEYGQRWMEETLKQHNIPYYFDEDRDFYDTFDKWSVSFPVNSYEVFDVTNPSKNIDLAHDGVYIYVIYEDSNGEPALMMFWGD